MLVSLGGELYEGRRFFSQADGAAGGTMVKPRSEIVTGWKCGTPHALPSPSVLFGDPFGRLFDQ